MSYKITTLFCRFSDEEPQYLSSSSADVTHSRADFLRSPSGDTSALATLAAGGGSSAIRKSAAKSDTLKRKAVGHNNSYHQQTLPSSSAAKSETLKRKTDGHHQIFGTAEFNSRNRRKSVAAAAAGESAATLRRKSEDRGSGKVRVSGGGGGGVVSAAEELSEYLLRQSADSSSYGLFSRKSADKVADSFTTVHFSEIPRPKLLSTGVFSCSFVK
jgi:hypothetical protein